MPAAICTGSVKQIRILTVLCGAWGKFREKPLEYIVVRAEQPAHPLGHRELIKLLLHPRHRPLLQVAKDDVLQRLEGGACTTRRFAPRARVDGALEHERHRVALGRLVSTVGRDGVADVGVPGRWRQGGGWRRRRRWRRQGTGRWREAGAVAEVWRPTHEAPSVLKMSRFDVTSPTGVPEVTW
eukprot:scaffold62599_cov66-Phaeocystis_antarctica.AAC.10